MGRAIQASEIESATCPVIDIDLIINASMTLQNMIQLFRDSTGLDLFLVLKNQDDEFEEQGLLQDVCKPDFCSLMQHSPKGHDHCKTSHETMCRQSVSENRPMLKLCHSGLVTIHYPISLSNGVTGDIQTTCAIEHGARESFSKQAQEIAHEYGLEKDDVEQSIDAMRILSKKKIQNVMNWLELVVDYLCESSNKNSPVQPDETAPTKSENIIQCSSVEYQIRSEIARTVSLPVWRSNRSTGATAEVMELVQDYVLTHYSKDLSAKIMAQALGYDPGYFSKKFKEHTSDSFVKFVGRIRLQKAKEMLQDPFITLVDVSERCGFSDPAYFSNVFKKEFGVSPSRLR
ncbi:MAG: PocR ligand-binding domain-containing protein [Candidatus Hinthialibacter antarcticus]|nr:PocR ligand-binding domain-containing protein [Candidatus Hinthialibacter antarcticus]